MSRFAKWAWMGICLLIFLGPLIQLSLEARQIEADVWEHLSSHMLFPGLKETLLFALGTAFISAVVGTGWALLSLFLSKRIFWFSLTMALLLAIPTYVMGFVTLSFLDYSGPLQVYFLTHFGEQYFFEPRTRFAAIVIYGLTTSPYVYFSVLAGLQTQIKIFTEASVSLGAGFFKTFRRVLFPGLFPWILGGSTLVALEAVSDFGFVDLFGVNTLSRVLYKSWGSLFSFAGAARISLVLLVICLLILGASRLLKRNTMERTWSQLEGLQNLFPISKLQKNIFYGLFALGVFAFNIFPLLNLLYLARSASLWQELPWAQALSSTVILGSTSSLVVGVMMAGLFFLWKKSNPRGRAVLNLFFVGYGLPGTLLAVGFFLFATQILGANALSSGGLILFAMLILLYFSKYSGLMLRGLINQDSQNSKEFCEAADTLGSPRKKWLKIELPLFSPALILGFFLLFLEIVKELPAALMIKPLDEPTLALRIHQFSAESDWERASVYSLVLILLVLLFTVFQNWLSKRLGGHHVSRN